jgi:NAD+ diphosphatase
VLLSVSEPSSLVRRPIDEFPGPRPEIGTAILLGIDDGAPLFALDLEELDPAERSRVAAGAGAEILPLRDAGAVLPHAEAGLAAYLMALLNWHRRHRFCANCGAPTDVAEAGYLRHCPRCGASHFPRTDPVVIMLVEHNGSLLLGRRPGWPRIEVLGPGGVRFARRDARGGGRARGP